MAKASCKKGTVRFKTSRGKVVQFKGRHTGFGTGCSPRSTAQRRAGASHLKEYARAMKAAAPGCKRSAKGSASKYRHCIGNAVKSASPR